MTVFDTGAVQYRVLFTRSSLSRSEAMSSRLDRRDFLAASALSAGSLAFLDNLPAVSAADAKTEPNLVHLDSGIEPLVRLVEETPREKLLEEVAGADQEGAGLSRRADGAAPGGRTEYPAAAERRLQVPRGAGRQLGAPGEPRGAGQRPLAADVLGTRQLQELAGAEHQGKRLADEARR